MVENLFFAGGGGYWKVRLLLDVSDALDNRGALVQQFDNLAVIAVYLRPVFREFGLNRRLRGELQRNEAWSDYDSSVHTGRYCTRIRFLEILGTDGTGQTYSLPMPNAPKWIAS